MNGSCLEYIKSDCFRYKGNAALKTMILLYLKSSTFRWQVAFRLVHGSGTIKMLGEIVWYLNLSRQRIQIEKRTSVGYGLYCSLRCPAVSILF